MFYFIYIYIFEPKGQNPNPDITQWTFTKPNAQLRFNNVLLVV